MANRWTTQFIGSFQKKLVNISCNFVVDATNGNGNGVRSLKGGGVQNVYMNTSASITGTLVSGQNTVTGISGGTASLVVGMPVSSTHVAAGTYIQSITSSSAIVLSANASGSATEAINYAAVGSPTSTGPAAGLIYVTFQDNYNRYLFGTTGFISPASGSNISISGSSVMTVGAAYIIVSVGTSTSANWTAVGLPSGIVPAVGATFIATVTGGGTGTGVVQAASHSGIMSVEVVGDPNQTIISNGPSILGANGGAGGGAYLVAQCLNTSSAVTAPAAGSVVGMSFFMSNSSIIQQGQ